MAQSIGGLQGISNFAMLLSLCTAESLKSKKTIFSVPRYMTIDLPMSLQWLQAVGQET